MKNLKFLFVVALFGLVVSSCSDNEPQETKFKMPNTKMAQDYKDTFFKEDFMDLSKEEMGIYISKVSEEYGVNIASLSQSQAISYFDSISFSECVLEKIEKDVTSIDWIQSKADDMNEAVNNNDTVAIKEISIWFYNFFECEEIDNYDDLRKDLNCTVVKNQYYSKEAMGIINKDYPQITSFAEEDQVFILTLASYYKNHKTTTKAASSHAQRCSDRYNKSIKHIYIWTGIGLAACAAPALTGFGAFICVAGVTEAFYSAMDEAQEDYYDCMHP